MSGKSLTLLAFYLTGMLCVVPATAAPNVGAGQVDIASSVSAIPQQSDRKLDTHADTHADTQADTQADTLADTSALDLPAVLIILGLREEANQLVRIAISEELSGMAVQHVDAQVANSADFVWPSTETILATGKQGCQVALEQLQGRRILCTLLTEEGFRSLDSRQHRAGQLSALVIDQPVSRQAQVANRVYPSLSRFSVLSGMGGWVDERDRLTSIDHFPFNPSLPLSTQLSDALYSHDALIATSDSSIFNSTTLSPVLLTAYGYHKPVIGFSRAYVKAGSLITCFSTPSQILREVAQMLHGTTGQAATTPAQQVKYPKYFSVIDNVSVARSLDLIRGMSIVPGQTLTDADVAP